METPYFYGNENYILYQGDTNSVLTEIKDKVDVVFADPPYFCLAKNFEKVASASRLERHKKNDFIRAARKCFFFFGDTAQSIYKGIKQTLSIKELSDMTGIAVSYLNSNYRLPKPVAKALYVAMTRTYRYLYVMYSGGIISKPLQNVPSYLYKQEL